MTNEHVLIAAKADELLESAASSADARLRSQLERSLAGAYRLASVILGNPSDAEDATQDALERAWRARDRLRDEDRFDAWFQRIVVNACRDRLRRRRSTPIFTSISEASAGASTGYASDPAAGNAERAALSSALDRLNADQRIAVAMRYFLDLEVDEIARRVGTRPGTIKSRLHRGLNQLRRAWEEQQ